MWMRALGSPYQREHDRGLKRGGGRTGRDLARGGGRPPFPHHIVQARCSRGGPARPLASLLRTCTAGAGREGGNRWPQATAPLGADADRTDPRSPSRAGTHLEPDTGMQQTGKWVVPAGAPVRLCCWTTFPVQNFDSVDVVEEQHLAANVGPAVQQYPPYTRKARGTSRTVPCLDPPLHSLTPRPVCLLACSCAHCVTVSVSAALAGHTCSTAPQCPLTTGRSSTCLWQPKR